MDKIKPRLDIPVPKNMQHLPRDKRGFIIPWFVEEVNGERDFRIMSGDKLIKAFKFNRCWVCGQPMGTHKVFVIGPMCAINRVSAEPPSHSECAEYSAQVCPFLTTPKMVRNEKELPEEGTTTGVMIKRNPGVALLWYTKTYKPFQANNGVLFRIGPADKVAWYAEGRKATDDEIMESVNSGIPILREVAESDGQLPEFYKQVAKASIYFPKEIRV